MPLGKNITKLQIRKNDSNFVHEVSGLDAREISDIEFEQLEDAFDFGGVLFLCNQDLRPSNLIRFSKRFSELEKHVRHEYAMFSYSEILLSDMKADNRTISSAYAGDDWRLDLCFMREPARMANLYAIEIPRNDDGDLLGDTPFASGLDAYNSLDRGLRKSLENKKCLMQYNRRQEEKRIQRSHDHPRPPMTEEQKAKTPNIWQPIFRTHPTTDCKAIYANKVTSFQIEGNSEADPLSVIQKPQSHVTRPENI